jgi:protein pelota
MEDVIKKVEEARGTVVIVSEHHEAGRKLKGLGGIAALLRFKIE